MELQIIMRFSSLSCFCSAWHLDYQQSPMKFERILSLRGKNFVSRSQAQVVSKCSFIFTQSFDILHDLTFQSKKSFEDCVYIWLVGGNQAYYFKQPWHKHFVNIDCCHCHFTKLVIKCVLQEDLSFELCALQLSLPQGEPVVITSWTYPQYLHNRAYPLFLSLSLHSLQYFDLCF